MEDISMSFDVNPLSNIPQLKPTKTQDGGAGNLGYFEQERKKREEEEELEKAEKSSFGKPQKDTFTLEDAKDLSYVEPPLLLKIVEMVKKAIFNLFH